MKRKYRLKAWLYWGACVYFLSAAAGACLAQLHPNETPQGQNVIRRSEKWAWGKIYGAQSDVYYFNDNKALGDNSARMLAQAYYELSRFFEYRSTNRIQMNVYPSPQDYTTVPHFRFPELDVKNHVNWFSAYHQNDYARYYKTVKTETARVLLEDMFYGGGGVSALQNRVLLYVPDWYVTGMSRFLGEGWDPEDESVMRSLVNGNVDLLKFIHEKNYDKTELVVKKSIWYYINRAYGPKKINEIAYMTRLTRSGDGGFTSALGLRAASFTIKWLEFCSTHFKDSREEPNPAGKLLLDGGRLAGAAMSPSQKFVAYITEKKGVFSLSIYTVAKGKAHRHIYRTGIATNHPALKYGRLPIAWAPDGARLVFAVPHHDETPLIYLNLKTLRTLTVPGKFQQINSIHWAPDGKNIVFSGFKSGFTDIYHTVPESATFTPVTFDPYDDLDPIWAGDRIIFSSNRDTATALRAKNIDYRFFDNNNDLYAVLNPIKDKRIIRLTKTPYVNERAPYSKGDKLYMLTDSSGLYNLAVYDSTTSTLGYLTDFNTGLIHYQIAGDKAMFFNYDKGTLQGYINDLPKHPADMLPTPAAEFLHARFGQVAKDRRDIITYAEKLKEKQAESEAAEKENSENAPPASDTDTTKAKNRVFFYFDEDEPKEGKDKKRTTGFSKNRKKKEKPKAPPPPPFDINGVRLQSGGPYEPTLLLRGGEAMLDFDPVFRFNGLVRFLIEDPFRYHRIQAGFRAFMDFKSTDAYIKYQFLRYRFQYEASLLHTNRFFDNPQPLRHTAFYAEGGVNYPIDAFNRIGFYGGYTHIDRTDLRITDDVNLNAAADLARMELRYVHDNTKQEPNFVLRGTRLRVSLNHNYSISSKFASFTEVNFDVRKYFPLPKRAVLAARLSGGAFFGRNRPLYMLGGVESWINSSFVNDKDIPIAQNVENFNFTRIQAPLRGFGYNARNGYHFGVTNVELRLPLTRMFQNRLPTSALYNLQWIFFYDVGLAWKTGNPIGTRDPIDAVTIIRPPLTITVQNLKSPFIMGLGTGLRTNLLGFFLRADIAMGIEDGSPVGAQFSISLGKDF